MAQTVIINGVTYNDVKELQAPLASDPSQMAVFPDTSDADVPASGMLDGYSGYANGKKVEGGIPIKGAGGGTISTKDGTVSIPEGYYDGTGFVGISEEEKAKLISSNIRKGETILGIPGGMDPQEGVNAQSKTVTPTKEQQVIQPDSGYTHLLQVTMEAIPDKYVDTTDADATAAEIANGKSGYVNGKKVVGTHTDPSFTLAAGVLTIK